MVFKKSFNYDGPLLSNYYFVRNVTYELNDHNNLKKIIGPKSSSSGQARHSYHTEKTEMSEKERAPVITSQRGIHGESKGVLEAVGVYYIILCLLPLTLYA